jgi:DNA primase
MDSAWWFKIYLLCLQQICSQKLFSMEIHEIKNQLNILAVLSHYNFSPDRNHRLICPWHNDKSPSLQIYPKTNTWTCFSTNCAAGSGDQIDFIMKYEKITKHQAILKAKALLGYTPTKATPKPIASDNKKRFTQLKMNFKSGQAVKYLAQRKLDRQQIEVGYNATAWEHLRHCLVFPLRNPQNEIVSFYGRSIYDDKDQRHFYLKNRSGLYPKYPSSGIRTVLLTESIIDAATLLQVKIEMGVLAMYGTNGLTEEHQQAIQSLKELEEVILFFDGDEAGRKAIAKWSPKIKELRPEITVSYISTPEGEDVNSLWQSHEAEIFHHLLSERLEAKTESTGFLFSIEPVRPQGGNASIEKEKAEESELDISIPNNIFYKGQAASYYVKGQIKGGLESMKVSLQIINENGVDYRSKIDLYEYKQVSSMAKLAAAKLALSAGQIESDLSKLTNHLEQHRQKNEESQDQKPKVEVPQELSTKCIDFLKTKNLLKALNELIGKAGIIGEEQNRIFLFVIASSYKMLETLHALVQGSSGSGKTHLIVKIGGMMPEEDTIGLTRITDSSLYNYGEYELQNKLLILEDLDGLKEDAFLAFRELQSREILSSSTSVKDDNGNIRSQVRTVRGPIGSLSATTKGAIYEDNMSRCFLIAVDESKEQTQRIIDYQNRLATGKINKTEQKKIRLFLQNCIRLLKPYEVVNLFAEKIKLPKEAHKIRRLNELFQSFVKQITLLNQYQRKKDKQGRLITEKADIKMAVEIMFESIVLKVDELDGSLRQFYERLKKHVLENGKESEFTRREIRHALGVSKTQQHAYMNRLQDLEYIYQANGYANRGYRYKVSYWDDISLLRAKIRDSLEEQLGVL